MSRILGFVLITLLAVAPAALAEDLVAELVEAEGLYDRHCGVCHGLVGVQVERAKAAEHAPAPLPLHAVRLAMDLHPDAVTDTPPVSRSPVWPVSAWRLRRPSAPT